MRGRAAAVARCRDTGRGWPADSLGRALSLLYDDSAYSCTDTPGSKIQDRTLAAQARARRKPDAPSGAMSTESPPPALPPHRQALAPRPHRPAPDADLAAFAAALDRAGASSATASPPATPTRLHSHHPVPHTTGVVIRLMRPLS
ncbi:hypothetical protein ACRJ4B_50740 [Streptomyces sp. GTA36]|uniref:hypothetical protein n=1 Tax=Streptomyces sp. 2-1 TaxID=412710 RepID=UPI003AFB71FB